MLLRDQKPPLLIHNFAYSFHIEFHINKNFQKKRVCATGVKLDTRL
jgi:hypothetical protein